MINASFQRKSERERQRERERETKRKERFILCIPMFSMRLSFVLSPTQLQELHSLALANKRRRCQKASIEKKQRSFRILEWQKISNEGRFEIREDHMHT